ncbi:MAG: response regulator transcription factor, partial [Bacteroidota bacterium]
MTDILLVDDHAMIRDAIKFYFESSEDFRVAGEAAHGGEALELLKVGSYEVVVTDINMPEMDGLEFMGHVQKDFPGQKVLVLSMLDDAVYINKMIALGANGYILKNAPKEELFEAVSTLVRGENYYSKEIYQTIIESIAGKKPKQRLTLETSLSKREKEVLRLIVKEYSNQEIADELFISIRTVEAHKRNLLDKTGAKNIAGLVMFAVER